MSKSEDFVHLHVHTDFSLLQGAIKLKPLAERLQSFGMEACAITDYGNMFGAVSFYNTMKAFEIKPILGYEAILTFGSRFDKSKALGAGERPYYHLVLLARDFEGYRNLCYMASRAYTEGFLHKPRIDLELLEERSGGLLALSSGLEGAIGHFLRQDNFEKALAHAKTFEDIFGRDNFYLEITDHGLEAESKMRRGLFDLSKRTGIPLVATNDAHYLTAEDARAHEVLMCIGEGKTINDGTRRVFGSDQFYLRDAGEMWSVFGGELPEALRKTLEIAEMCNVEIPLKDNLQLPEYPIPVTSRSRTTADYFEQVVSEGFADRKKRVWDVLAARGELKYPPEVYEERIREEIGIIRRMGFPGYFLIVWDFIRYAREQSIPVGPGRGSAAGSLVAYCLGITDIDPIQYDLLFERFLNPERVSMPDIDIDFCIHGRGRVIEHVSNFYGKDSVCQIITFGTMASKASIKDVGRVLNMPYADVERIAKMIPPPVRGRNVSIGQAIEQVTELREAIAQDRQISDLVDLARRLEGCARHTSVHAAGVVISPKPLEELVPTAVSSRNEELTSQYPMGDLEKVGMLKMDFLALTTLTIISDCLKTLKDKTGTEIDWSTVPLTDEKTMGLFAEGRTEAIFQFESGGMQEICRRLKPKELEDLAALNALYRPGPLDGGMVDDFILRHRGEKRVRYIVPEMKEILENTYGILVYQEQIMQLAQKLAGYTLGEADMMRRAMGKKKRSEMAVHEEKFIEGAVAGGIEREKAEEIFKLMAQFADYGFNRSHSVAYAYVAFQTAYLKAHYPSYFYASVLSNEAGDTAKIYKYANELRHAGLGFLPPDVNESDAGFTPLENAVRFGLTAIKGIGSASVQAIIKAREEGGRFSSLYDFTARLEPGSINRRGLESLVAAGAFDSLNPAPDAPTVFKWRARLHEGIGGALAHGQRVSEDKIRGQNILFGEDSENRHIQEELPDAEAWSEKEFSQNEKNAVGFYLSTHPLDTFGENLKKLRIGQIADYENAEPNVNIQVAGMVSKLQMRHSKKGNRFCIFRLEDRTSGAKCLVWSEALGKYSSLLRDDELIIVRGRVESNEGQEITLIVDEVKSISETVFQNAVGLNIFLPPDAHTGGTILEEVFSLLGRTQGNCMVYLNLELDDYYAAKVLAEPLRIRGSREIERHLKEKGCRLHWDFN
jgi:DNA polymerase III subunit alpha